jgi:hypothetical protein
VKKGQGRFWNPRRWSRKKREQKKKREKKRTRAFIIFPTPTLSAVCHFYPPYPPANIKKKALNLNPAFNAFPSLFFVPFRSPFCYPQKKKFQKEKMRVF